MDQRQHDGDLHRRVRRIPQPPAEAVASRLSTPGELSLFDPSELLRLLILVAADLDHDPLLGDDVWDLSGHPAWRAKAGSQRSIDYTGLAHRWRTAATLCGPGIPMPTGRRLA